MKKVLVALIVLASTHSAFAQNVSFGPSIGVEHSWITGMQDVAFKPGFSVGGVLTYSPAPHWGVGGDVRFSFLEGVKTKAQSTEGEAKNRINATYLRVPLKATYFFGEYGEKLRPKLYVGPSFGFLLGGKTTYANSTIETKTSDVLETFDWGFVAGAGFNYRLKPNTWLNFDLAYNNGLKDATKVAGYHANRNISMNLGVTFPLGTYKR